MEARTALATLIIGLLQSPSLSASPTTAPRDTAPPLATLRAEAKKSFEVTGTVPSLQSNPSPPPTSATRKSATDQAAAPVTPAEAATTATSPAMSTSPTFDSGSLSRIEQAIATYSSIASHGGWQPIPHEAKFAMDAAGQYDEILRQRLIVSGDLAPSEVSGPYDTNLATAVKRFQMRHGLAETGLVTPRTFSALNVPVEERVQQLEASSKRIAAIGFSFGKRYVVVNLPGAYAEAVENDLVARRYRVIVGKTEKPSPTVTAEISDINLNPTWTIPASITKNEIAAHMRKDATYLSRTHMQVLDAHDAVIDPATVDWSVGETSNVVVRQEPGAWNALGQLRVNMPNSYAVYMHDTNQRTLFSDDYRFDSHGCVRVENVRDLAVWLLQDSSKWARPEIDAAIATGRRQDIKLQSKVPVAWIYLTGWKSRDQIINFRDDIYDQDRQLVEATAEEKAFFDQAEAANVGGKP